MKLRLLHLLQLLVRIVIQKSNKDEDKQNASKSDKSSVEKSESNEETTPVEPMRQSKPTTSEAPPSQNIHNEDSMYDASTE